MAKKRRRRIQNKTESYLAITNPFISAYADKRATQVALGRFLTRATEREVHKYFESVYSRQSVRSVMASSATKLDDLAQPAYYRSNIPNERITYVYQTILNYHKEQIKKFINISKQFEISLLAGDYKVAQVLLDQLESECGESVWLTRSRILTLSLVGKPEEMQEYAQGCKERLGQNFLSLIVNCTLVVTANPRLQLSKAVATTIREFAAARQQEWADLLTLYLVPQTLTKQAFSLHCLHQVQLFSVVDQFLLLRSLLSHNLAVAANRKCKNEEELLNFILSIERDADTAKKLDTQQLIGIYEAGDYGNFIESISSKYTQHEESAALANLISKSHAITKQPLSWLKPSLFKSYLESLINLYTLNDQPNQAEDTANASIALLHHLSCSTDLQHCLLRASPFSYPEDLRLWTARRTRLLHPDRPMDVGVPLADVTPDTKQICSNEALDEHRRLRKKIISRVFEDPSPQRFEALDALLAQFEQLAPTRRDYLELLSMVLTRQHRQEELIAHASRELSVTAASYTAFPIENLVNFVEETALRNLDAVIVVYFYTTRIDQTKEYLLNETYEEFLVENGIERPSDLIPIQMKNPSDARYEVFFLEVSKIETMDFLSCFESSSDLWSERVKLLDHLQSTGKLEHSLHSAEVDEIVKKVVIDSTATEFNVAKVDVNDEALKRSLIDDVTSLQALYRSYEEDGRERIIRVDDIGTDGTESLAMVAGDKSSALHKIVALTAEAFISDEKHGLAKNLSAEIRHGFFSNQMRSKAEELRLLTELNQHGEYARNFFWYEQYKEFLNGGPLDEIDQTLRWFSEEFNKLIVAAEEWIKVSKPGDDSSRVFKVNKFYLDEVNHLHSVAELESPDILLEECFNLLWQKTETSLMEMRHKINVDLRNDVNRLFDELLGRLDIIRGAVPLANLMDAAHATKNGLQEDLTAISEWFRRKKDYGSTESRTISELIRISIECLNRVRGCQLSPRLTLDSRIQESLTGGRNTRFFIIAIINLLENCIKHSGLGASADLEIHTESYRKGWRIVVSNTLSEARIKALTDGEMDSARERLRSETGGDYARTEGKSGLKKVLNHLQMIDDKFDFDIEFSQSHFEAKISHEKAFTS